MSSVCSFLTMLERDATESSGNVRRMLSVCSEFERIAKVALDKAEREIRGRGKRKQAERERARDLKDGNRIDAALDEGKTIEMMQVETQAAYRRPVQTPSLRMSMESSAQGSPASWGSSPVPSGGATTTMNGKRQSRSVDGRLPNNAVQEPQAPQTSMPFAMPMDPAQYTSQPGFAMQNGNYMQQGDFTGNATTQSPPQFAGMPDGSFDPTSTTAFDPSMSNIDLTNSFGNRQDMLTGTGSFQQPFVPQDLWQMPMTLEWDWAEGLSLGSFTPGPMYEFGGTDGMLGNGGGGLGQ